MNNGYFEGHPLVSDQVSPKEIQIILHELKAALNSGGDVVEFGCYVGTTSLFLQRSLKDTDKILHVYDSFAGLPHKGQKDISPSGEQFKTGELLATKSQLITNFKRANLPLPIVHKGWFGELTANDLPGKICFAYLDGDFYESIMSSLKLIWPRLTHGARVVVDDYSHEALPGAGKAVNEWLSIHPANLKVQASLAIIGPIVA